jgi:TonB family protein
MRIRRWIALPLCAGALAWSLASPARANERPASAGQVQAAQAAEAREAVKDTVDFKIVDEVPKVVKSVPPRYPEEALRRGLEGRVFVRALVKKDGVPIEVSVAPGKGVTPELDQAAVDAVKQWRFITAKSKGKTVAVWIVVPVNFRLK